MPRPAWLRDGITFRDSFAELIAAVFGSESRPRRRSPSGAPSCRASRSSQSMRARSDDSACDRAARRSVARGPGHARGGEEYTLLLRARRGRQPPDLARQPPSRSPERTSTSALTRPLLQDFVFRPDVFVGGPAEVSYYAQIASLYDILDIAAARGIARTRARRAEAREMSARRFGIQPRDVFAFPTNSSRARARRHQTRRRFAERGEADLLEHIEQIADIALPADHALARARSIARSATSSITSTSSPSGPSADSCARTASATWP